MIAGFDNKEKVDGSDNSNFCGAEEEVGEWRLPGYGELKSRWETDGECRKGRQGV